MPRSKNCAYIFKLCSYFLRYFKYNLASFGGAAEYMQAFVKVKKSETL